MEKFKVSFVANNQQLTATGTKHASDTYADIEATFALGERWTDMDSVSAVWWNDFTRIATVLDSEGKCTVPHEVLMRKGCVRVNLVGSVVENGELVTRLTSYSAEAVHVNEKIKLTGSETTEITPSQFEQFVENVKADADRAESAKESAQDASASAQGYAQSASASASSASESATSAEQSATASARDAQTVSEIAVEVEVMKNEAELARDEILGMSAEAVTLPAGSEATASYADGLLSLGIPRGNTGATGAKGDKGDTGATPNLTIGDVETLEPTESATATITGTAENPVLNLGIPQGDTGEVSQAELDEAVTDLKSEITSISNATEGIANAADKAQDALFDNVTYNPTWEQGVYAQNGFFNSYKYARAKRKFPKGKYTITPKAGYSFMVAYYVSDSSGTIVFNNRSVQTTYTYADDFYLSFKKDDDSNITAAEILNANEYVGISLLDNEGIVTQFENVSQQVDEIVDYLGMNEETPQYVSGISTEVLKSLYIPNLTGWKLYRIASDSTYWRFAITLSDGETIITNGLNNVGTAYSDAVQTLVNPNNGEVLGYYVVHYIGEEYYKTGSYTPNETYTSSLEYNPIIKEYLERDENLVLIGDSIFGFADENQLASLLSKISKKRVFNCGFGGCTMVKQTSAPAYNPLTFGGVADSIASGDFTAQKNAIGLQSAYPYRYADLASVDWSKPTTIFVDYVNNDITQNSPLGNLWSYTDTESDWDVFKFTEAMTYGLKKILTEYPHIRVVFFTSKWRFVESNGIMLPPYVYENGLSLKAEDYNNAIKENANRLGVSVYDFLNYGGANAFNADYMMIDGKSHFTIEGYEHFAEVLNNLDQSFIM